MKLIKYSYLLSSLLMVTPASSLAEDWQFIVKYDSAPDIAKQYYKRPTQLYIDKDSFVFDDEYTVVWKKLVFDQAYTGRYGKEYKFTKERWVMHCKDRKMALVENELFDINDERLGHKVVTEDQLNFFVPVAGSRQAQGMLYTCSHARKIKKQRTSVQADAAGANAKPDTGNAKDSE